MKKKCMPSKNKNKIKKILYPSISEKWLARKREIYSRKKKFKSTFFCSEVGTLTWSQHVSITEIWKTYLQSLETWFT